MNRLGFTLIELLIVIVLTVAVGALVFVGMSDWTRESRHTLAVRQTVAAAQLARSAAQRSGESVRLFAGEDAKGAWIGHEPFRPGETEEETQAVGARTGTRSTLPDSVRFSERMPVVEGGLEAFDPSLERPETLAEANALAKPVLTLAVFLPDGTAWSEGARFLIGPGDLAAELRVNRWTGAARLREVKAAAPDEPEAEVPEPN